MSQTVSARWGRKKGREEGREEGRERGKKRGRKGERKGGRDKEEGREQHLTKCCQELRNIYGKSSFILKRGCRYILAL